MDNNITQQFSFFNALFIFVQYCLVVDDLSGLVWSVCDRRTRLWASVPAMPTWVLGTERRPELGYERERRTLSRLIRTDKTCPPPCWSASLRRSTNLILRYTNQVKLEFDSYAAGFQWTKFKWISIVIFYKSTGNINLINNPPLNWYSEIFDWWLLSVCCKYSLLIFKPFT